MDLELRILSGLHHGAVVPLDDQLSLGSTHENDVLLRDPDIAGLSVLVFLVEHGWSATGTGLAVARKLDYGKRVAIGRVVFTVDDVNAPWPAEPITDAEDLRQDNISPVEKDVSEVTDVEASPVATESDQRKRLGIVGGVIIAISCVLLLLLMVAAWLFLQEPVLPAVATTERAAQINNEHLAQYQALLSELGIQNQVRVQDNGGVVRLVGAVENQNTIEILASRLQQLRPVPGLSVTTVNEAVSSGNEVVQRFSPGLMLECRIGHCTLTGSARTKSVVDAAHKALKTEVPQLPQIDIDVQYPLDIGKRFVDELKKIGITGFTATWDERELVVSGGKVNYENEAFLNAVRKLNEVCQGVIPFRIILDGKPSMPSPAQMTPRPPFDIVAVVSSQQPYVTTSTGENILLGGIFMGYRLVKITPDQVVFEGPKLLIFKRQ